ncbi:MAG: tetratricopeptide repeat protein [Bacteroidales bacterium]|nr:tetratricopeptide repeat protein [Bacteroidales bacterium]
MKKLHTIALGLTLLLTLPCTAQKPNPQAADSLYRQADYPAAIAAYEAIAASGWESPELYYNLGNAYYRDGQNARSILNYERALRLRPSMRDAQENLALAVSHTTDRITPLPQFFLSTWYNNLRTHTSPTLWSLLCLLFLALLGASIVGLRLGGSLGLRKASLATAIVSLLLAAISALLLATTTSHLRSHSEAIVMEATLAVKSSPEPQSADKLILHEGTKVSILDQLSDWCKIQIADGTIGWCPAETIERI